MAAPGAHGLRHRIQFGGRGPRLRENLFAMLGQKNIRPKVGKSRGRFGVAEAIVGSRGFNIGEAFFAQELAVPASQPQVAA